MIVTVPPSLWHAVRLAMPASDAVQTGFEQSRGRDAEGANYLLFE